MRNETAARRPRTRGRRARFTVLLVAGGLWAWQRAEAAPPQGGEQEPLALFEAASAAAPAGGELEAVVRSRVVRLRGELLAEDALVLDLFGDVRPLALREGAGGVPAPDGAWLGRLAGEAGGSAVLVRKGDALAGTVRSGGRVYRLRPLGGGLLRVEELDGTRMPACRDAPTPAAPPGAPRGGGGRAPGAEGDGSGDGGGGGGGSADAGGTAIDVLVVYTPQARAAAGGTAGIEATIELAVLEANQAYAKSGVPQHLRLVHSGELAYAECGDFNTELGRLRTAGDGHMDDVHELRDRYGADLVSLIVASSSYCGMAYRMPVADAWFADYAFSVVARDCATGYYSFAHELGHNMGCAHDHANASASMYAWGYGHRGSGWRTIMSYAPGVRVDHFSNPAVGYSGEPTGVAGSGAAAADNADVLARNAGVIAGFRGVPAERYGTGKTTSLGEIAWANPAGEPSVSGAGLRLRLRGGVPLRSGLVHFGPSAVEQPFLGGTLYVAPPLHRLETFVVGADGKAQVALPADASLVGQTLCYQMLFRDPAHPDGSGAGMTNGVRVTWLP